MKREKIILRKASHWIGSECLDKFLFLFTMNVLLQAFFRVIRENFFFLMQTSQKDVQDKIA